MIASVPDLCILFTFHKVCTIIHYPICALIENWLNSKCCKFVKNIYFDIKLLHAHLQYGFDIPGSIKNDTLKALGGVDFTKYEPIIYYPLFNMYNGRKIG